MGHKRTIRPNAKKLSSLFKAQQTNMDWVTFARKVKSCQRDFMGEPEEMKIGRGDFHEFPYSCICQKHNGSSMTLEQQYFSNRPPYYEGIGNILVKEYNLLNRYKRHYI